MQSGCCAATATVPARWTAACPNGATRACPPPPHDQSRRPSPAAGLPYGIAICSLTFPARLHRAVNVRDGWRSGAGRGAGRGTGGREIPVQSALLVRSVVLSVQVTPWERGSRPLVMRRRPVLPDRINALRHYRLSLGYEPDDSRLPRVG